MHEVLVNRLGGLSLPRKIVVRLIECPDKTVAVYRGCKTIQQSIFPLLEISTEKGLINEKDRVVSLKEHPFALFVYLGFNSRILVGTLVEDLFYIYLTLIFFQASQHIQ